MADLDLRTFVLAAVCAFALTYAIYLLATGDLNHDD